MRLDTLYKRNTNPKLYEEEQELQNCGSFALGVDGWYCPYIENDEEVCEDGELWRYAEGERIDWIESLVAEGHDREEIMEDVIERDFEFILMTCPWLEEIQLEDMRKTDRVIAYRLCLNIPDEREEFDMEELEEEMGVSISLPIALIEAEDDDYAIEIVVFEDAADAEELYDAYAEMAEEWGVSADKMGIGIEGNCVYMGDEEAAEIAFGK